MAVGRITSRIARTVVTRYQSSLLIHGRPDNYRSIPILGNRFPGSPNKVIAGGQISLSHNSFFSSSGYQRFGFSSSASPQSNEKGTSENGDGKETINDGNTQTEGSDDLTMEDLIGLVTEKEELIKTKQQEMKILEDKLLRSYADMENIMARTKREAENSKKFAIQNFAKSLLDVADNLDRASSVVKESFAKLDTSSDNGGAVPLLKTLLEGVEMTEKQLAEVFKKFGVEKYDPINEEFDPNRHNAVFQVPDPTKSPDIVAVVLKAGYTLHDRIIRPAEVGVTIKVD